MKLARQASALLLWAAITSRGLFAQQLPAGPEGLKLRGAEIRYVLPEPLFDGAPPAPPIKALYVNAWAFGSSRLWHLVRLADSTEINALVVDVKDDTGCLLYASEVKIARDVGATRCIRARDARARLDTLRAHDIYPIARIVVA
ncbi:MAG: putative glycoside hydrolase, partial [Gemmatimonadales bacterium]